MKKWKLLLGAGMAGAVEYGIASYFFHRTILRQNAKTERTIQMAGTNWEQYMPMIKELKDFMQDQEREDIWIRSEEGLKLHGTFFPGGGKKAVICFHGYTSRGMSDFIGLSNYYLPRGYQMLLADERAHGESEGKYIGFGCLDRQDAMGWIRYVRKRLGEDCEIWLHGISMGGATALMTGGLQLPKEVRGIISDCAFTSAWDVFSHVLKSMYHMPVFPVLHLADQMVFRRAGYRLAQCNAANEVQKVKVPVLFIHGDADTFVPCWMCYEIYENCRSHKDILIVKGAGHAESFYRDRKRYEEKLTEFLEKRGA